MDTDSVNLEKLDVLVDALEDMIEIQDKIFEERFYSNYREVSKLRSEHYYPARDQFKHLLSEIIDEAVEKRLASLK